MRERGSASAHRAQDVSADTRYAACSKHASAARSSAWQRAQARAAGNATRAGRAPPSLITGAAGAQYTVCTLGARAAARHRPGCWHHRPWLPCQGARAGPLPPEILLRHAHVRQAIVDHDVKDVSVAHIRHAAV